MQDLCFTGPRPQQGHVEHTPSIQLRIAWLNSGAESRSTGLLAPMAFRHGLTAVPGVLGLVAAKVPDGRPFGTPGGGVAVAQAFHRPQRLARRPGPVRRRARPRHRAQPCTPQGREPARRHLFTLIHKGQRRELFALTRRAGTIDWDDPQAAADFGTPELSRAACSRSTASTKTGISTPLIADRAPQVTAA